LMLHPSRKKFKCSTKCTTFFVQINPKPV